MFKKAIKIDDVTAVTEAIDAVRGRAITWTMSASDLKAAADEAEERLAGMGLILKDRLSVVAIVESNAPLKTSKRQVSPVIGSRATLRRHREGWRLTGYERAPRFYGQNATISIRLPTENRDSVIRTMLRTAGVEFVPERYLAA